MNKPYGYNKINTKCLKCEKSIISWPSQKRIYCSSRCGRLGRNNGGGLLRHTQESKDKIRKSLTGKKRDYKYPNGVNAKLWRGGHKEAYKRWALKNQDKIRGYWKTHWRKRRALKKNASGSHTNEDWETLKEFYGYMCLCCKRNEPEIKLTEDHIIPLSRGGSDNINNIQPLCSSCNSKKRITVMDYRQKNIYGNEIFYH